MDTIDAEWKEVNQEEDEEAAVEEFIEDIN